MKNEITWKVKETACFPNKYKVYPSKGKEQNGLIYFYPSFEEAKIYADKLNKPVIARNGMTKQSH